MNIRLFIVKLMLVLLATKSYGQLDQPNDLEKILLAQGESMPPFKATWKIIRSAAGDEIYAQKAKEFFLLNAEKLQKNGETVLAENWRKAAAFQYDLKSHDNKTESELQLTYINAKRYYYRRVFESDTNYIYETYCNDGLVQKVVEYNRKIELNNYSEKDLTYNSSSGIPLWLLQRISIFNFKDPNIEKTVSDTSYIYKLQFPNEKEMEIVLNKKTYAILKASFKDNGQLITKMEFTDYPETSMFGLILPKKIVLEDYFNGKVNTKEEYILLNISLIPNPETTSTAYTLKPNFRVIDNTGPTKLLIRSNELLKRK